MSVRANMQEEGNTPEGDLSLRLQWAREGAKPFRWDIQGRPLGKGSILSEISMTQGVKSRADWGREACLSEGLS